MLAAAVAVVAPMLAVGQVNPEATLSGDQASPYKYEVYAGYAYTSLKQINLSRHPLQGGKIALTRDFGKYFMLTGSYDYLRVPLGSGGLKNPGNPSIYSFLVSPGVHAEIYEKLGGRVWAEFGGEHTGGESMTPSVSFAGGFGVGMTYDLTRHWMVQVSGDRLQGSFSLTDNSAQLAYSTHRSWNTRASFGAAYRF